ncbi:3-oxoacyl-[acyl-carrier-protein] synthase III C-terminal domain-containing protein [Actinocorallia sp. B10E7]|uniref:3-oxoacyl-[acyl-carrier-protein] synthase III C-terminal domain-containing protein n=1 Tax=Actinocorallia sp. B10E7 TaxID=3153558 RepID=UPI00325C4734
MGNGEVYAEGFAYSLGDRRMRVRESAALGLLVSDPEDLEAAGFGWHHTSSPHLSSYDLAREAVSTLVKNTGDVDADAIVYATCLPLNGNCGEPETWRKTGDVKHLMDFPGSRLQADFGLDDAVVVGINQQACTSMIGSLRLARALLLSEPDWRRVLCVTADRFPEGSRYEQAYNPISDGGAACLVGREPRGVRLKAFHQLTNGGLAQADDDETVGSYFAYTHRLVRETLDRAGLAAADLDWVVTQNTHEKAWRILARLLGIAEHKIWFPSLHEVGHVISGDNIINLRMLLDSGRLVPGQKILTVMAGFGLNWQAAVLEAV